MQTILRHVVSQGLGRKAGSHSFQVSGKTGTAQVSQGGAGYRTGQMWYWLSFCGYFPSDNPRYSCIVCLKKPGLPASGGGMAGAVFHNISEGVMAKNLKLSVEDARDSLSVFTPDVKQGNRRAADYVLAELGLQAGNEVRDQETPSGCVPNLKGMGARDAVYALEQRGLKVRLTGTGHVRHQSIAPGSKVVKGATCDLALE